ncbi:hypothetical protein [Saccharothrix longispora]|uniref:hypothetical protein n=1 Tax=Saccharothrix longispora TaxID=33920 RepID=UPI0028FD2101|nr:hypothetical protein [Saccharothrix longispora]MDU0293160.1 hypothetical protein [Saccharothrix longispora]
MDVRHPTVRRTWRARLPVEFSHFVLFDFTGHFSPASLDTTTDSRWIGRSGDGGALFHADDHNLEADVLVALHDTEPHPDGIDGHSYSGTLRTDTGSLVLAASTASPGDITVDLPAPGSYRLRAHRQPDPIDTSLGDEARCEQWTVHLWPDPTTT